MLVSECEVTRINRFYIYSIIAANYELGHNLEHGKIISNYICYCFLY